MKSNIAMEHVEKKWHSDLKKSQKLWRNGKKWKNNKIDEKLWKRNNYAIGQKIIPQLQHHGTLKKKKNCILL